MSLRLGCSPAVPRPRAEPESDHGLGQASAAMQRQAAGIFIRMRHHAYAHATLANLAKERFDSSPTSTIDLH